MPLRIIGEGQEVGRVRPPETVVTLSAAGLVRSVLLSWAKVVNLDVLLYDGSFEDWSRRDGPVGPQGGSSHVQV